MGDMTAPRGAHTGSATATDAEPSATKNRRVRLDSLTGLRFFAAFAVFAHHFNGASPSTGYGKIPLIYPQSTFGTAGVTFFFVLSGFVLTWAWRPDDPVRHFYWRRVARIMPAHLVALVLAVPVFYWMSGQEPGWGGILLSAVLLQGWVPHLHPTFPGNPVSWTLSCEMFFYLIFPWVIRPLMRRSNRQLALITTGMALVALGVASVVLSSHLSGKTTAWIFRLPLYSSWHFLLGIVAAIAVRRGWRARGRLLTSVLTLALWVLFLFNVRPLLPGAFSQPIEAVNYAVTPLLLAWIVAVAAKYDVEGIRTWVRTKPLLLLGAWSYAFYLVHQTVIRVAMEVLGRQADTNLNAVDLLVMGAIGTALAAAVYYGVEHPAERRLRSMLPSRPKGPAAGHGTDNAVDAAAADRGAEAAREAGATDAAAH